MNPDLPSRVLLSSDYLTLAISECLCVQGGNREAKVPLVDSSFLWFGVRLGFHVCIVYPRLGGTGRS